MRDESTRLSSNGKTILRISQVIGAEILEPKYPFFERERERERRGKERLGDGFGFGVYRTKYLLFIFF